jgi:hypothetical protein
MARCSICQKTLRERLLNWRQDKGPFGFEVVAKVGSSSYKCVCNRCGHTWLSKTKDAAFQFNEPEKHKRMKETLEKNIRRMNKEREQGYTILVYPKLPKD